MKKTILAIAIFAIASAAQYGMQWIQMTKTGSESINFQFAKCYYKQSFGGDFRISIVVQGGQFNCPYSIQYNPVSGQWR